MPYTALTPQTPTRAGLTITFASADGTNGNSFSNNGRRVVRIKNTGSSATATFRYGKTLDGAALTGGKVVTVPATTGDIMTSVWTTDYTQADGSVYIDWSTTPTGVTVAVIDV